MGKLTIQINGHSVGQTELKPGVNRVGRSVENDVQISHPSVSGSHCEIVVQDGQTFVRDLGSTNGTFLNNQPVQEAEWIPGQSLKVGAVTLLDPEARVPEPEVVAEVTTAAAAPTAKLGLRVAKIEHAPVAAATVAPDPISPSVARAYAAMPSSTLRDKTFFGMIFPSFAYPFQRDGLIFSICGTLVFLVLDFLGKFSFWVAIIGFGYLAAFVQKMIVSSAQGEEDLPGWPEFSDWWGDILHPALLLVGSFAAAFAPAIAFFIFAADMDLSLRLMIGISLVVFGCFYVPMALIATAMYGSLFALNPLLIVPSMIRIFKEYIVACLLLALVVGIRAGAEILLEMVIPIPVLPTVISAFLGLYLLIVEMRILGLLYFYKEDELAWSF